MKVIIDREKCIACQACGTIASELFFVPPGHKSLFKKDCLVYSKKENKIIYSIKFGEKIQLYDLNDNLIKEFERNDKGFEELSDFLGEGVILVRKILPEDQEQAEMGENACPVAAIQLKEDNEI